MKDERNLGSRSWSATAEAEVNCSLLSLVWLVCLSKSLFVGCCRIDYWSRDGAPKTNLHWIVPMLFSILFDIGMLLIFVALISYLTDAYEIYAASANAASSITRSIFFGVVLPSRRCSTLLTARCPLGYEPTWFHWSRYVYIAFLHSSGTA